MKKNLVIFAWMLLVLPTLFMACGSDDEEIIEEPDPMNIVETAAADAQFSTLVAALQRVNLDDVLNGDGPFTVFAPTNQAFIDLNVNLDDLTDEELTEILLYHVLGAKVNNADIQDNGQTYITTAAQTGPGDTQLSLLISKTSGSIQLNGNADVTTADVDATNGVIHIIDNVLLPLNVVGHASANSSFSDLLATIGAATGDLGAVLSGDGPFTVFAPVNSAFQAITSTTSTLTPEQLEAVLKYHVVEGNVRSSALSNGQVVATVNGQDVTINIDGSTVTVTDAGGGIANVALTDVQATNGVIHVLEAVLIPTL